jgi:O-antigen biosynthesis protein
VIARGKRLVYEPASLVYHEHRRDYTGLCKQMHYYGIGLTAYFTKLIVDNPLLLFKILARLPQGLFYLFSPHSGKNSKKSTHFPKELTTLERGGLIYGPWLYLKGRFTRQEPGGPEVRRSAAHPQEEIIEFDKWTNNVWRRNSSQYRS